MEQEIHLKILRHLKENPHVNQRELARELGVSLGKANYCLQALIEKGFVKAQNFRNAANKRAYLYVLTPEGLEAKIRISMVFLKRKTEEYEELKREIDELLADVSPESVVQPSRSGRASRAVPASPSNEGSAGGSTLKEESASQSSRPRSIGLTDRKGGT